MSPPRFSASVSAAHADVLDLVAWEQEHITRTHSRSSPRISSNLHTAIASGCFMSSPRSRIAASSSSCQHLAPLRDVSILELSCRARCCCLDRLPVHALLLVNDNCLAPSLASVHIPTRTPVRQLDTVDVRFSATICEISFPVHDSRVAVLRMCFHSRSIHTSIRSCLHRHLRPLSRRSADMNRLRRHFFRNREPSCPRTLHDTAHACALPLRCLLAAASCRLVDHVRWRRRRGRRRLFAFCE